MEFLFFVFSLFAIGSIVLVIILTTTILMLLKNLRELEDELEANLPPF
jgi:hypothetical protein